MKRIVITKEAPAPIGPYSQAVVENGFVFVSGQTPLVPSTGELARGDVSVQTELVLTNISRILAAAGTDMERVIKTTVFLADMDDFASMNEVYARFFKTALPARSTVQVARLPLDASVEIEVIATVESPGKLLGD
jgi:2-iminobutanoate/2-iminopropanoate deaminase